MFTSPNEQAIATTKLIAAQFNYEPEIVNEERIRQKECGILDGLTKGGIDREYFGEAKRKKLLGKYYYRPKARKSEKVSPPDHFRNGFFASILGCRS